MHSTTFKEGCKFGKVNFLLTTHLRPLKCSRSETVTQSTKPRGFQHRTRLGKSPTTHVGSFFDQRSSRFLGRGLWHPQPKLKQRHLRRSPWKLRTARWFDFVSYGVLMEGVVVVRILTCVAQGCHNHLDGRSRQCRRPVHLTDGQATRSRTSAHRKQLDRLEASNTPRHRELRQSAFPPSRQIVRLHTFSSSTNSSFRFGISLITSM
jgi:hypothetical protein